MVSNHAWIKNLSVFCHKLTLPIYQICVCVEEIFLVRSSILNHLWAIFGFCLACLRNLLFLSNFLVAIALFVILNRIIKTKMADYLRRRWAHQNSAHSRWMILPSSTNRRSIVFFNAAVTVQCYFVAKFFLKIRCFRRDRWVFCFDLLL